MRILEEDFEEQAARGGRKVENDALWRAAYEIVRRDNPGVNRAELFRLAKAMVDEQSLKFAATASPPPRKFGAGSDKEDRLISLSGLQRITQLAEDTYEAWSDDLWSYLSSNPKARAMVFNNCSLGYDRRLDDELGGLLGLTVDNYYKKTTITVLRKQGETRGTVIFAQLKADVNRDSVSRRSLLRQKMLATVQKSAEGIQEYAERHRTLFAQLGNIDDTLNEPEKVEAFLKGLTPAFFGLKEALYTSQFTSGRALTLNETVNFMMTMEEKRTLGVMTAPPQVLPRFGARQAAVDVDKETPTTLQLEHLTEEEAHAFVARFNSKFRPGSRPGFGTRLGPPSGHPQEADWFAGECNFCLNPGHREARCRMRARLLDGAGPGSKYDKDAKPAAHTASGEDVMEEVDARLAQLFPQNYGSESKVEARVGQVLSGNLE
ncbi:hypothetical protein A4X06_0g8049 [Tilletia controversa]|uniref:Retrotransposon gag domain-containing protein n=4 Tax=Tilletia TaxID=13289 RepID=A0A8X7MLV8_9BASI|nr:hypothetical protein A4X06_0g8049 [Tilletia controversa]